MANKFNLKSLMDADSIVLITPILIVVSTFHIFDTGAFTHKFGQIEILAAIAICCYYLCDKIAVVYPAAIIRKKRIEAITCIAIGIFTALVFMAPLMTWQYFNLYRSSDRITLTKPILIAVASLWIGCAIFFSSSYLVAKAKVEATANNTGFQESSMPDAMQTE